MHTSRFSTQAICGMSLREAKRLLIELGGRVESVRRTGEVRFRHRLIPRPSCPINNRRIDAPRHAVVWLRRLEQLAGRPLPPHTAPAVAFGT